MTICTTFMHTLKRCVNTTETARRRKSWAALAALILFSALLCLCSVNAAPQLKPPTDNWPTYHGDYTGQRHSPLTEITPSNVNQLAQVWRFQTGQNQQIK